jgi:hypothetical protein
MTSATKTQTTAYGDILPIWGRQGAPNATASTTPVDSVAAAGRAPVRTAPSASTHAPRLRPACRSTSGYTTSGGPSVRPAARVGPIPDDAVIVPKSGESSCIRPDHLWAKNKTRFHRDNQGRANVHPPGTRGGEAPALSAQSGPGADYRRSGAGGEADRERPSRPATVPLRAWVLISESACAAGHNGTSLRFHMAGGKALRRRRVSQRFLR